VTSGPQVARLLTLVPYLQKRAWVDVGTVARDFGISPGQVLRDLEVLVMCGLPGGLPDDLIEIDLDVAREEGVIHLRNAPVNRPMRLTTDEAVSLLVAVEAVRETADADTARAAQRVIDKLSALVGQTPPVSLGVDAGPPDVRTALAQAIDDGRRVCLTYDGAARRETTTPLVDPAGVEVRDGVAYLIAWSLDRGAWRTYRLDRIAAVEDAGQPADAHGSPPAPAGWFDEAATNLVTLDLAPTSQWVAEYYPTRKVQKVPGGIRVTLAVGDPGWLSGLLLRLGPDVRAVDPPSAAAAALAEARACCLGDDLE